MTTVDFLLTYTARFSGAMTYSLTGKSPWANFPNIIELMGRISSLPGVRDRLMRAIGYHYLPPEQVSFKVMNFKQLIDEGINPI